MNHNNIALLRKENGLNQKELAEKLGVVQATVSAWETGRNEPDNETMQKIANLFKANFAFVAGYESEKKYRRLTDEETEEMFHERMEKQFEKEQEYIERGGMSDEEIDDILEHNLWEKYSKANNGIHFEAYQYDQMCEYMSAEQRKRSLSILKLAFPNATRNIYNPD